MSVAAALLLAQASAPMAPQLPSPAVEIVDAMLDLCVPFARGEVPIGLTSERDAEALRRGDVVAGISQASMDRLGPAGSALISRSVIGERSAGADAILIAIGGAMPGCRAILLSDSEERHDDRIAEMLDRSNWREAPASAHGDRNVVRRMFVKRAADRKAYLINLMSGTMPGSDVRIVATAHPVPPGVELPEGF